ncbi:obscurin-like protein 1 [Mytilus edulis]|uniref:obscurin-like protein 1 n=1 Tax=Mytilus edulis TaxID=6550 RepID=UPI0039F0141D
MNKNRSSTGREVEDPSYIERIEGENETLTCNVRSKNKPVYWTKDGKAITLKENCTMSNHGTEHKLIITKVKADDSGEYSVKVGKCSKRFQLKIIDCFLEDPSSVEYIEGEDAILTCKISPTSLPVEWLKDGNAVKLDEHCGQSYEGTTHNLIIKNVTLDRSGVYCMKVGNFSRQLHLKIKDCFLEDPSNVEYIEGEDAILTCKVSPTSLPVEWFKDGSAVDLDDNCEQSNEGTKHILSVKHTKSDDSGEYCVKVGNFSRKLQLKIKDYFLEGPSNVECIEGKDATLTCKVRSTDQPANWTKDGKEISFNENCTMSNQGTKYNLIIKNVISENSGEYCMQVGKFSKKIQLKVKGIEFIEHDEKPWIVKGKRIHTSAWIVKGKKNPYVSMDSKRQKNPYVSMDSKRQKNPYVSMDSKRQKNPYVSMDSKRQKESIRQHG